MKKKSSDQLEFHISHHSLDSYKENRGKLTSATVMSPHIPHCIQDLMIYEQAQLWPGKNTEHAHTPQQQFQVNSNNWDHDRINIFLSKHGITAD